jgi:hypothetical protein
MQSRSAGFCFLYWLQEEGLVMTTAEARQAAHELIDRLAPAQVDLGGAPVRRRHRRD